MPVDSRKEQDDDDDDDDAPQRRETKPRTHHTMRGAGEPDPNP